MIQIDQFVLELETSISLFKPEMALVITFVVALMSDLVFKKSKNVAGYVAIIGLIISGYYLGYQEATTDGAFANLIAIDPFAKYIKYLVLMSTLAVILMSFFSKELYKDDRNLGEYFALIVGMTFGMYLLAGATNLLMVYLAIETMSISSYILTGYTKEIKRASEASLKYVIFGAVASGIMIYGISILFGLTGTMNLLEINTLVAGGTLDIAPLLVSGLMIIAGIAYKISAVPFHFWTPDVYEGAPITITAYLSVASKAAGIALLIRFLLVGFTNHHHQEFEGEWIVLSGIDWKYIIAILAVLTMTIGNFVALWQTNLKRMFAYSSIAHAGYMLMGVAVMTDLGIAAVLVYLVMYLFMNTGAFYVVMLYADKVGSEELDDFKGVGYRAPILGVAMTIFMISLTGLPPTAGFIGKLQIFTAVLNSELYWLALIGIINSVVSLFYYAKVFRNMFVRGMDDNKEAFEFHPMAYVLLMVFVIPVLYLGLFPSYVIDWASRSVGLFMGM
jgi:NADH-quinone oxidoreductase subunit N